jgi:hypothetical protein
MNLEVFLGLIEGLLENMGIETYSFDQVIITLVSLHKVSFVINTKSSFWFIEGSIFLEQEKSEDLKKTKKKLLKLEDLNRLKEKLWNNENIEVKDLFKLKRLAPKKG